MTSFACTAISYVLLIAFCLIVAALIGDEDLPDDRRNA